MQSIHSRYSRFYSLKNHKHHLASATVVPIELLPMSYCLLCVSLFQEVLQKFLYPPNLEQCFIYRNIVLYISCLSIYMNDT